MPIGSEAQSQIEAILGHRFSDPTLIARALTHSSFAAVRIDSNERLEFLGDSILGFVVCEHLFVRYPEADEGTLTKIKSYLVSRAKCAEYSAHLGLSSLIVVGKGFAGSALPVSIAGSCFEALIAALYLDAGIDAARRFVLRTVEPHVDAAYRTGHQMNFKSVLQQVAQAMSASVPVYCVVDQQGPDHSKNFAVRAEIGGRAFGLQWGLTKKSAEQAAALAALRELGLVEGEEPEIRICFERLATPTQDSADASTAHTSAGSASPSTVKSASDS
ncbi:MAG: ribonuclease III [Planctomycetes bacterium]|nr:ribonuclease III [Planctomycetota bacterium]